MTMSDPISERIPKTASAASGGPPSPPKRTKRGFAGGGEEPQLSPSEWAAITKFHTKGYDEKSWTQKQKLDLASALNKAYGPSSVLRGTDAAQLRKWLEKVGFLE